MIDLIILLILNSLYIIGFYNAVDYDRTTVDDWSNDKLQQKEAIINKQFLWFIAYYTNWLPQLIKTPLYDCIKCMASIHSLYIYWAVYDFTLINLFIYFFYIFALSGLNALYEKYFD